MSAKRENGDLNNLSASLHSIISGDAPGSVNIPFVDEDESQIVKSNGKSSDSISSNESYKVNYKPHRRAPARILSGNDASDEDTDDGHLASEKRDNPGPLASEAQRSLEGSNLGAMRRNSISMPVLNESQLDRLHELHMKSVGFNDDTASSKESLSKIEVSSLAMLKSVFDMLRGAIFMILVLSFWYNCFNYLLFTLPHVVNIDIIR